MVVVVVTKRYVLTALLLLIQLSATHAAVLPEDRADALYHSYDGGGIEISGPSILVRKGDDTSFSVFANHYVDNITSASIDVEALGASQYTENREEQTVGIDYLHGKSILSLSHTNSAENDYVAESTHVGLSMDMLGGLTTVSMGFSRGSDDVFRMTRVDGVKVRDPNFAEQAERRTYQLGLTQVLTKSLVMAVNFETVTDEGYLNNPYRQVRYNNGGANGFQVENYPNTRTSRALGAQLRYFLPYRAAVHVSGRVFEDDWGVTAVNSEFGYSQPLGDHLILDFRYRVYSQTHADFYRDLFDRPDQQNYYARDKELSSFSNTTMGVTLSYEFIKQGWGFIDKASANFSYDRVSFEYENFRDIREDPDVSYNLGEEPLYSFTADIVQFYLSLWY